jgi:hypothetical protein
MCQAKLPLCAHYGTRIKPAGGPPPSPMIMIETGDRSSIVDAGRAGLFALRRIEGGSLEDHFPVDRLSPGVVSTANWRLPLDWREDRCSRWLERRAAPSSRNREQKKIASVFMDAPGLN